jgi:hypothetical protein
VSLSNLRSGLLDIQRDGDGFKVVCADPIITITMELLVELCAAGHLIAINGGDLFLVGQVRYRPICVDSGRNLVLQRIDD